ncbi:MAG: isochorismate synthase [Actinomycetota bacterium]
MIRIPAPPTRLCSRSVELEPVPDLIACLPAPFGIVWLHRGEGFVAWGEAARIEVGHGPERFLTASSAARNLLEGSEVEGELGPLAFGSFCFDPDSPGSWLVIPAVVIRSSGGRSWMTLTGAGAAHPDIARVAWEQTPDATDGRPFPPPVSERRWLEAVASAREAVREGRLEKVVLARDLVVEFERPPDPRAVASRLTVAFPECFTFAGAGAVGATPELLVRRERGHVSSVTLGGSAPRAPDPAEDARLGEALVASPKDRLEHELAVRTVREALERVCGEVRCDPRPSLLPLANIQHLRTHLEGRLTTPLTALELAGLLHPTAAVCGVPAEAALGVIRELEGIDRGHYAGPVGWVDAMGDGEWAIALRCAELSGRRARLFAGAGIVSESDPEQELEETRLKLRAVLSALAGG